MIPVTSSATVLTIAVCHAKGILKSGGTDASVSSHAFHPPALSACPASIFLKGYLNPGLVFVFVFFLNWNSSELGFNTLQFIPESKLPSAVGEDVN